MTWQFQTTYLLTDFHITLSYLTFWVTITGPFAVALAGVIGTYIIAPHGWRWGYGITAVLALMALFSRMGPHP